MRLSSLARPACLLASSAALGLLLAGCPAAPKTSKTASTKTGSAKTASAKTAAGKTAEAGEGRPVVFMPNPQRLAAAKAAAKTLGGRLKAKLQAAIKAEGFPGGVRVCGVEAPAIRASVEAELGVKLGRTSFRLRNPKNRVPAWAEAWVKERSPKPRFAQGPSGTLRALLPIKTAPLCVSCHGPAEAIAPKVRAALGKSYPEDAATGFKAGDLRGWFWVELPAK